MLKGGEIQVHADKLQEVLFTSQMLVYFFVVMIVAHHSPISFQPFHFFFR